MKAAYAPSSILSEMRLCPSCGEMKLLQETFGPKITAIAISAWREFAQTFRHNGITRKEESLSAYVRLVVVCIISSTSKCCEGEISRVRILHHFGAIKKRKITLLGESTKN